MSAVEKKYSDADIIAAIERCKELEKAYCRSFCKQNPAHTAWREQIMGYIISGMNMVYDELRQKGR